jgi:His/Glu/Gln/Arg/opine family amino acid ABC transporter permease subunit
MTRLLRWGTSERGEIALWRIAVLCGIAVLARWASAGEWRMVAPSWLFLLTALGRSWLLAIIAIGVGALAAAPLALLRVYGPPGLRHAAVALIEAVRSTPELMIVFWVYFTWPLLAGGGVSAWNAAIGSLSVIAAAYFAEVIRAGLYSVPGGQIEAARASGLSPFQAFRDVVLPQALRNMLPALIAQLVALFKTTSLVYAIGVMDFFRAIQVTGNAVFAPYALYIILGAGYFVSCAGITRVIRWFDPKYQLID